MSRRSISSHGGAEADASPYLGSIFPVVISRLTPRENEIADLLSRGLANPAIAERAHLSVKTVANYVSIILLKLGVDDRAAAAALLRDLRRV